MTQWDININGINHTIVFDGCKLSGKAKLIIDNEPGLYSPYLVKSIGLFYPFELEGSEIILKLDLSNNPVGLIQDGTYIDTGLPMEEEAVSILKAVTQSNNPMVKKEQTAMGSFLTFVILTFVNLGLILVSAPISFPFSASIPQLITGTAFVEYSNKTVPIAVLVVCIVISVVISAVYLMLYLFSKKYTWSIIIALILIIIDTLILVLIALGAISDFIIDILFHIWVIWSLINIIRNRKAISKIPLDNKSASI